MPLVDTIGVGPIANLPQPQERERPGALDTLAAAARQSNMAGAAYDVLTDGIERPTDTVPDYDPAEDIAGYEDFADRFLDSRSPAETAYIKQRLASELADRQTLADAGGWGLAASLGFGVTDPATLLSMAIPFGGATRGARLLSMVGGQVAADSVSEAVMHSLQETRTATDSVINIGAGAVFSGLLGGIAESLSKAELNRLTKSLGDDLDRTETLPVNPDPLNQSFGAASAATTTRADETIARGGETLAKSLGKVSPGARLMTSRSVEARRAVQELTETPELLNKNFRGVATPQAIETSLKRLQGAWWQAYAERRSLYRSYRKRVKEEGGMPISRRAFGEEVAFAMRRGDESPIPEVAQSAARTRALVFEPLKARAQRAGLLAEDVNVTGAMSYLMRQYNTAKIRREMSQWIETLEDGFIRQGVDRAEAADIAHQVTRNILGSERGTLDLKVMDGVAPKSGRLKERELKLPDAVLEPWLVNDIDNLTQAYLRTMGPEVEITERFGDRNLDDVVQKVKDEYGVYKSAAKERGDDKALKALQEEEAADIRDLLAIRDRLYGHFGAPKDPASFFVRAGRLVRSVNYTRLLGGQVIQAMTDIAKAIMQFGAPKMMSSAFKLVTNIKALKLARSESRRMGIALDMVLNTRGIALGDIGEYSTFAEQAIARRVNDVFSIASLQSPWNAIMKSWVSVMSQDDVLKFAAKVAEGGQLSKMQTARMASIGLDEPMLKRIANQFEEHGTTDGLRFGRSDQWTDAKAAKAFENAIIRESDTGIVSPGQSDLPLFYSTEVGKAVLQFKSFGIASVRRLQIPAAQGLAQADLNTMTGVAASFGIGAMVYVLKQMAADQPITDDPAKFAAEVIDKSGLLGWSGDIIFPGLWQFGSDDLSRWSDRQPIETALGPVVGTVAEFATNRWPAKVLGNEDLTEKDLHKLRKLLPGQNLFYLRRAINSLEEASAEATL